MTLRNDPKDRNKTVTLILTQIFYFLPFLVKKSLEYLPDVMILRGTLPSSSMISAIWSAQQTVARGKGKTNKTNNRLIRQCLSHGPTLVVWVEG